MARVEHIGEGITLHLGDCRDSEILAATPRRKPWTKARIRDVVTCRKCEWTWKPTTGFAHERCPNCTKARNVQVRERGRKDVKAIAKWRAERPGYSAEQERAYRRRALLLIGRGSVVCVGCGCDRPELIEINHKNGGGGKEARQGDKLYRQVARLRRAVDDLELLCRPCNAVHALELKHGSLPFRVTWGGDNAR